MSLKLMYITNRLSVALIAEKYGVDRIWIDLETLGKEERQKGRDTVKSHHTVDDIRMIKPHLKKSELLVRINQWNKESVKEINDVIDAGADIIMLPYWKTVEEVQNFIDAVKNRCKTTLLLETKEADACLEAVLEISGVNEIHIGLNDLHLSYNLTFMFELITNGTLENIIARIKKKSIPYGFGGIAKIGDGIIPAEMIIMEHYRVGSTRAILSRTFCDNAKIESPKEIEHIFSDNMKKLREFEKYAATTLKEDFEDNRRKLETLITTVSEEMKRKIR